MIEVVKDSLFILKILQQHWAAYQLRKTHFERLTLVLFVSGETIVALGTI